MLRMKIIKSTNLLNQNEKLTAKVQPIIKAWLADTFNKLNLKLINLNTKVMG